VQPALKRQNKIMVIPGILATQEAEIRRIKVRSLEKPYLKRKPITKKGWWSGSRCRP
jgi:hypothetical protein